MTGYLIYLAIIIIFPIYASLKVNSNFKKYSRIEINKKKTGKEIANSILKENNINDVKIKLTKGKLSDHYDPKTKTVNLSKEVYAGMSISSAAIAAHEVGHAIQHSEGYAPLSIRSSLFPIARFGSSASFFVILSGALMSNANLLLLGVCLMTLSLLFHLVTLPVELNASSRAKFALETLDILEEKAEIEGVSKMLKAAAMTYVATVLVSLAEIIRFLIIIFDSKN